MGLVTPTTKYKQPWEKRLYAVQFEHLLVGGSETIASIDNVSAEPTGLTLGEGSINGTKVQFDVSSGTHGVTYSIRARITTSTGNKLEGDGKLLVLDITQESPTEFVYSAYYCDRADIESQYGRQNVLKWADLDNNEDAEEIEERVVAACDWATNEINDYLRGGPYELPISTDPAPVIKSLAAQLAGVWLYEARGIEDFDEETGRPFHKLQWKRDNAYRTLKAIRNGQRRIGIPTSETQTNVPMIVKG